MIKEKEAKAGGDLMEGGERFRLTLSLCGGAEWSLEAR